jgi:hypothetical protein
MPGAGNGAAPGIAVSGIRRRGRERRASAGPPRAIGRPAASAVATSHSRITEGIVG